MAAKLVIANWKMNPASLADAQALLSRIDEWYEGLAERREPALVVCPPFVFIEEVGAMLRRGHLEHIAELGAQDIAAIDEGAQTGEVSGAQLERLGVRYCLVGHSDRRWKLGEDDATVNAKLHRALEHGLMPVVCLGERTRGTGWQDELRRQADATFSGLRGQAHRAIVAYEPVWAISTKPDARPDSPEGAGESIAIIRSILGRDMPCLYGGSVTAQNAAGFLSREEISGVLVGGASLRPEEFVRILEASIR
ncbi:MAG TPA: triose-phosphate isomerase [Candidatus Paceibacterota bacterium]|nr:triose-phosphate isomerase [Candidatus Paceibacterota bacterium]